MEQRMPVYTRSSAVAKRPRDASCLSVVSVIVSIVQYLKRSCFIIRYFSFGFTSLYNSILFCCLQRNVKPCCHTHDLLIYRDCTAQYNSCLPATTDCQRFCHFVFLFFLIIVWCPCNVFDVIVSP